MNDFYCCIYGKKKNHKPKTLHVTTVDVQDFWSYLDIVPFFSALVMLTYLSNKYTGALIKRGQRKNAGKKESSLLL